MAITVALPAGAGGNRRALRDVHGTKAFWQQTTLKRVAKSPGMPTAEAARQEREAVPARRALAAHVYWLTRRGSGPARRGCTRSWCRFRPRTGASSASRSSGRRSWRRPSQRKHPEIATYGGRGIDDAGATIAADLSPIGFHASVRSTNGGWYIDPYYRKNPNYYVSYHGQQLKESLPVHTSTTRASARARGGRGTAAARAATGARRSAPIGSRSSPTPAIPPTSAARPAVTAAKVALMNRVDQVYQHDMSIRMQLIAQQRPAQPQHLGRGDRAQRALRRRRLLHAVAGDGLLEHDAGALRDRPDHRRLELRHRPPCPRRAGRRRREPRRRRPLEQGGRLHRHPDARGRLLRDRLRGPRDGSPVRRQPSVQRQPAQLLERQPQRGALGRAGQRLLDHGVRGHLPDRRPAARTATHTSRSAASKRSTTYTSPAPDCDQRGADGVAPTLRWRQRGPAGLPSAPGSSRWRRPTG